jgi:hypothetical protein
MSRYPNGAVMEEGRAVGGQIARRLVRHVYTGHARSVPVRTNSDRRHESRARPAGA